MKLISIFLLIPFFFLHAVKTQDKKILICGVGKNVELGFLNVKSSAEKLGREFQDYRVIVYENNSTDKTKPLYENWAKLNSKIIFLSENLSQDYIDRYIIKIGDFRTQLIARARNKVLDVARKEEFADFDYLLMADLDEFEPWDIQEIINTIENPEHEWDAVFSNGSYDTYPLRHPSMCLGPELLGHRRWLQNGNYVYGTYLAGLLRNKHWIKMESGFGGLAIYKLESILISDYQGLITKEIIYKELNRNLNQDILLVLRPQLIPIIQYTSIIYSQLLEKTIWTRQVLEEHIKKHPELSLYRCEHIYLHQKMIENGFDKIYLNPKLRSINKRLGNFQ